MRKRRRVWPWVVLGLVVACGWLLVWATREPPRFDFLKKYPVVEQRDSKGGKFRIVVLKAEFDEVWNDIQSEVLSKHSSVFLTTKSNPQWNTRLNWASYKKGFIRVSNELKLEVGTLSLDFQTSPPEINPGYCAVAYDRPKTHFEKAMEWMRGFFGGSKSKSQS